MYRNPNRKHLLKSFLLLVLTFFAFSPLAHAQTAPDVVAVGAPTPSSAQAGVNQLFQDNAIWGLRVPIGTTFPNVLEIANSSYVELTYVPSMNITVTTNDSTGNNPLYQVGNNTYYQNVYGNTAGDTYEGSYAFLGIGYANYTFASAGTYYIRWCADMDTSGNFGIAESNYTNNCGPWQTMTVTPRPIPQARLIATPPSITPGGSSTLTWSSSGTTSCTGTNFSTGGATSGSLPVSPARTTTYSVTCTGPNGTSNPANATVTVTTSTGNGLPDITAVSAPTQSTATAGVTESFTGTNAIQNIGTGTASNFPNNLEVADASDNLITYISAGNLTLAAGASGSVSASYTFVSTGTYNVRWCGNMNAFGQNVITESNYGNNCGPWDTVTVTNGAGLPDITVTATPTGPASFTTSTGATFRGSITNIGTATGNNVPNVLQVLNSTGTTNRGYYPITNPPTVDIPVNTPQAVTAAVRAGWGPFGTAGTYEVRFCGNMNDLGQNVIAESNYSNNCGPTMTVTVTNSGSAPPSPASISCSPSPASAASGSTVTWTPNSIVGFFGAISYNWTDSYGTPLSGTTGSTYKNTYSSGQVGNSYGVSLSASDARGDHASASCNYVSVIAGNSCGSTAEGDIVASETLLDTTNNGVGLSFSASGIPTGDTCTITGSGTGNGLSQNPYTPPVTADSFCNIATTTVTTNMLSSQSAYTLTCTGWSGKDTVVVDVTPSYNEF